MEELSSALETPRESASNLEIPNEHRRNLLKSEKKVSNSSEYFMESFNSIQRTISTIPSVLPNEENFKKTVWCDGKMSMLNACVISLLNFDELRVYLTERFFSGEMMGKSVSIIFSKYFIVKTHMKTGVIDISLLKEHLLNGFPLVESCELLDLFRYFLDKFSEEAESDSEIEGLFRVEVQKDLMCMGCSEKNCLLEKKSDVPLEVSQSIGRSLEIYNREGRIINYCKKCEQTMDFSQRFTIMDLSTYLVLGLKRFIETPYLHKISTFCKFKEKIKMNNNKFIMVCMITHEGEKDNGRFVTYLKENGKWMMHSDKKAKKVVFSTVKIQNAHLLVYRKSEL